jgi:hypothetical protein
LKRVLKKIIRQILPEQVRTQLREQIEFKRLHRKPPELMWKLCASCPERRTDAIGAKIGHQFFLIGGLETMDRVLGVVDVFDLNKQSWIDRIEMPANTPQTHLGKTCDEKRFIYLAGGQLGPQCHPCVADCFVLDVQTKSWTTLPPLPEPRYSPTVQLWHGRLHVISGAKPDRWTSACDHWSLAVADEKALENRWREETPIPKGGPHRTSAVCDDRLYVFGGQDGDIKPVAGDPLYTCDWDTATETVYGDSFMREIGTKQWKSVAPMAVAYTHTETEIVIGRYAVFVGGSERHDRLSDVVQVYDSRADRWRIAGHLPHFMKTTAVYHDGWLYVVTGQRSVNRTNLWPGKILKTVWRARFDPAAGWPS